MRTKPQRGGQMERVPPQVEGARRTLWTGLLVFRWVFYAWMLVAAIALVVRHDRPIASDVLAWVGVSAAGAWTLWLTLDLHQERMETPYVDLALGVCLIFASSLIVPQGAVVGGGPFYAVAYPSNAALLWGAAKGPVGGIFAGLVLSVALVLGRPLNGIDLANADEVFRLVNGSVYYLAAGAATGVFSMLFDRWAAAFQRVTDDALRARERASKLAERQSLARQIHDSVLHGLDLIIRRGSQLADEDPVSKRDVALLTEMAREQERALRELVRREPEDVPEGHVSLRERMERIAAGVDGVPVTVTAVDRVALPIHHADELAAIVEQALDNVVRHAAATRAGIFLDRVGEHVIVSVRDNGTGFVYEEAALKAAGKFGILRSMKDRIMDLGGTMRIESAPGLGTEVEFRVLVSDASTKEGAK